MSPRIALSAFALVVAFALTDATQADDPVGTVVKLAPDAYGTLPGGERNLLKPNDPVVTDETIETSDAASLHIRLIDESGLWLDEKSQLVLDKLVRNPDDQTGSMKLDLSAGLLRFVTGSLGDGSYEVWTPTAVIVASGADIVVSVAPGGTTRVSAYQGRLSVRPRLGGSSVSVGPPSTAMVARATGPAMASPFVEPVGMPVASLVDRPAPEIKALKLQGVNDVGIGQGPGRQHR